jgi:hypothetical protein
MFKKSCRAQLVQDWFLSWDNLPSPHCHLCPGAPGGERYQNKNPPPALSTRHRPSGLFSLPQSEVRAGWPPDVPRWLQDELDRFSPDYLDDEFASAFQWSMKHSYTSKAPAHSKKNNCFNHSPPKSLLIDC